MPGARTGMGTGAKVAIGFVIFLITAIIMTGVYFFTARQVANGHEKGIIYQSKNMQNIHSQVGKIVQTSGLTVKNFGATKIAAIEASIKKYADKPKMMMMWVKENPQNIDSKVWEKFQDQMEKQYTYFANEQKIKLSKSQAYEEWLFTAHGTVAGLMSYPTQEVVDLMAQVIQTKETKTTFETGIDQAVAVF